MSATIQHLACHVIFCCPTAFKAPVRVTNTKCIVCVLVICLGVGPSPEGVQVPVGEDVPHVSRVRAIDTCDQIPR